jgi:RNA polymerase sigma-70 factor (ECF subfamily)
LSAPFPSKGVPDRESDEALVALARGGSQAAFEALLGRHQDLVYQLATRMLGHREDALDVAQDVFVSVFRGLASFESKARFRTWLYRVTVNRCRDELRRRASKKHARLLSPDAPLRGEAGRIDPPSEAPAPPETAASKEAHEAIAAAIRDLPEDAREVLLLRDVQDLAYEEIAEVLAVPVGTVRSRLHRARSLLRERIRPILGVES